MKCKLIRHDLETPNPKWSAEKAERAKSRGKPYNVPQNLPLAFGTVIDHPDAFRLVQQGVAIPEDEACRLAAGLTDEQLAFVQSRYDRLAKGIGYDEDGYEIDDEDLENDADDSDTGDQG